MLLLLILAFVAIQDADCQCTFPTTLAGTWVTSGQGTWIVNSSHIKDFRTVSDSGRAITGNTPFTTLTFGCFENRGDTKYVLESEPFEIFNNVFISLYICLDLREITEEKYIFYKATQEDVNGDQFTGQSDYDQVCNSDNYEMPYRYRVALKSGTETTALIQCPPAIFGTYTYNTCTDTNSNTTSMDVCDSRQQLMYNYTLCNSPHQMFSLEGTLDCVYFETNDTVTYLTVYNRDNTPPDDTNYFRFTCMALELNGNDVLMTVYPERCIDNQNTATIDSPGYAVYFAPFFLCPITSESSSTPNWWIYIAIGAGCLFLLLLIILIIYCCCCRRRKKKKKEKDDEESVKEDSESEDGSSRPSSKASSRRPSTPSDRSSIDSGIEEPQPTPLSGRSEEDDKHKNDEDEGLPDKVTELIITDEGEKEVEDKTSRPASSRQQSRMSDLPPSTIAPEDDRKTPASTQERQIEEDPNENKSIKEEDIVEGDKQSVHDQEETRVETPDESVKNEDELYEEESEKGDQEAEPEHDEPVKDEETKSVKSVEDTKSVKQDDNEPDQTEDNIKDDVSRKDEEIKPDKSVEDTKSVEQEDTELDQTEDSTKDDVSLKDEEIKPDKSVDETKSEHGDTESDTDNKSVIDDGDRHSEKEDISPENPPEADVDQKDNVSKHDDNVSDEEPTPNEDMKSTHSEVQPNEDTKSVKADDDAKSERGESLQREESEVDIDNRGEKSDVENDNGVKSEEEKQVDKPESRQDNIPVPVVQMGDKVIDDSEPDTKSNHEVKSDTKSNHEVEPDTKSNHEVEPDTKSNHEVEPDTKLIHKDEPDTKSNHEAEPDTKSIHKVEPDTKSNHEVESDTKSNHEAEPDTGSIHKVEPDTKSIHEADPTKQTMKKEHDDNQSMKSETKSENEKMETDDSHVEPGHKPEKVPVNVETKQEDIRRYSVKEEEKPTENIKQEDVKEDSDNADDGGALVIHTREKTPVKQTKTFEPNWRKQDTQEPKDSGRQTEIRSDDDEHGGTKGQDGGHRSDGYRTSDDEYQRQYHKIGMKGNKSFEPGVGLTTVLVTREDEERKRMKIRSKTKKQRMTKLARKRTGKLGHKSDKHGDKYDEAGYNENGMTSTDDEMLYDQSGNKAAFMKQYLNKKRLEHILDEQHYWSDPDDEKYAYRPPSGASSMYTSEADGDDEFVIVVGPDGVPRKVKKSELTGEHMNITDDELQPKDQQGSKEDLEFIKRGKFVTMLGADNEPWLVKKSNLVGYLTPGSDEGNTKNDTTQDGKDKQKVKDGDELIDKDTGASKHGADKAGATDSSDNIAFVKENEFVTVIGPDNDYKKVRKQDLLNVLTSEKDSDKHKKNKKKQRVGPDDDSVMVEKGEYVTIVGTDGIPRRVKKSDMKLYLDSSVSANKQDLNDNEKTYLADLAEKLSFVEEGDYVTVIGADGKQRRIKKTDLAKFLETEREKQKTLDPNSIDNLAYVENPENLDENNSKSKLNGQPDGKMVPSKTGEHGSTTDMDKRSKGAKTKLINVKERPSDANGTYRYRRHGDMYDENGELLSDFCDTDLDKISDRDSGMSDEEEEAVDVILTQDQQQMIVNMLFDEDMNIRPQFDRDENGRIVRRLDNTVIYDPHTGRFTYIKRLGQLFKVPRLRRNNKGRPTGGYIEDAYGPKELPETHETDILKVKRTASGKSTGSRHTKMSSDDQKRTRAVDGRNVGFSVPEDDMDSTSIDDMEYHKRGRRDLSSAFRKALSKRLFRKKRKRGATDTLPEVQLKKAWGGDPLLSVNGSEPRPLPPGGVSPLFSRSSSKMTPGLGTPGQQRRSTGTHDPEQLQRYREGLKSDQRILEGLQDKLHSDCGKSTGKDRSWDSRMAFEDVREEGGSDEESTGRSDGHNAGHDHGHYYTTADGRLVIRERGCPELKSMSQQKESLFMVVRRPEDIEREERERHTQNGGRGRNIHTAPVVLQSTDGSPRDSEHAQNSEESMNTRRSNMSQMTSIDDNRLRRLLEELYKDKKYFDYYIDTSKPKSDAIIHSKGLAEHGRGYLLERADYWERRGPLPPRPPQTAVGWRMQRHQTLRDDQMQRTSSTITSTQESIPGAIDSPRKDRSAEESGMFTDSNERLADDSFRSSELRQSEA